MVYDPYLLWSHECYVEGVCLDPRGHSNGSMLTPPGCTEDEVDEQLEADLIAAAKLLTEEGGGDGEAGEGCGELTSTNIHDLCCRKVLQQCQFRGAR